MHSFKNRTPLLVNDFDSWEELSNSAKEKIKSYIAIKSFICVPIVYEKESMGLVLGYNTTSNKRDLTQSDLSLMSGVASEIAISIVNAMSFQKLQESEERYRLLAENINDVIWKSDLNLNWRYISPSFQKLTGYSQKESMSLPVEKVLTPSSLNQFLSVLEEKLHRIARGENENTAVKVEVEYFCKDHSTVWAEIDANFLFDEEGNPNGILGVSRNIIDRKQAEYEKNILETKLKQKHKMEAIGTMAGGIAHDFNNILGIILGNAELATYDLPSSHPACQPLEEVKAASFRGKEVVMQLLNFARRTDHQKEAIKIVPIVKKALKSLRAKMQLRQLMGKKESWK
ncbi:MAG: PAS domain S-box protein [Deltaproteobacteria bacterium]|nr:PAS domain S-box protein [Deltaproteobacteria bacterium]